MDTDTDAVPPPRSAPVRWLRVLKLVLTVVLLALAVWNALVGPLL